MQELEMENMYQKAYIRVKCFKGLFTHDISNLFHTISNSLELCQMLLKEGIETEEILEYFKLIEEQINRGKKLVKNIRNLSELEESEMPLEPIDLFEILRNAIRFVRANFSNRIVNIKLNSLGSVKLSFAPQFGHGAPKSILSALKRFLQLLQSTKGSEKLSIWPEAFQTSGCIRIEASIPSTSSR